VVEVRKRGQRVSRIERSDARMNRERVMSAARSAFAGDGLEAPIREVARRAGVGVATVYRHFPTRADLITAVLSERVAACRAEMRQALEDPDPWQALSGTILRFAERQMRDRGLNEALLGSHEAGREFRRERKEHATALETLVARAHTTGVLRDGVEIEDVRAGLMAIASFRALPPGRSNVLIRRLSELLLAGLRDPSHYPASPH
jgi:AcrR family transcriptional regulator